MKTYVWLSPEKLKFINDNPQVVSLLYDLGLLPEEISARVRAYVEEERKRLVDWAKNQVRGHHKLAVEAYEQKADSVGDIHNSLSSAYNRLVDEIEKSPTA